jgi:Ion channel
MTLAAKDARARVWAPGSRVARLRASHSYGIVLALVFAVFVLAAAMPDDDWSLSLLVLFLATAFVTTLWSSGLISSTRVPGIALVVPALVVALLNLISGGNTLAGLSGIFAAVLTVATIAAIGVGVIDQGEANVQSIRGAVAVYVLFGLMFMFIYGAVAALGSQPLFASGEGNGTRAIRMYFSYVTLTTVGYGDRTPGTDFGRTLAVLEALIGQLYLVTAVALLVARVGHKRREM